MFRPNVLSVPCNITIVIYVTRIMLRRCSKFHEFVEEAYNAGRAEPFAARFSESSANGDREGMIKVLMDMPCIRNVKIAESYRGKDDVKAAEVYSKIGEAIAGNEVAGEQESRISILTETLFTASVTSRLFLKALSECAQHYYDSKAFTSCLKYCECMLALPANLYDKTAESMSDFLESRKACAYLRDECCKMLKRSSSRGRRMRRKCNQNESSSLENASPRSGQVPRTTTATTTIPAVDGKRHPVLQSCSDAVALEFDEKRGRRLVAARNIKAGSVLIVERPFAFATNKDAFDTNCLHCHDSFKSIDSVKIPCRFCRAVSNHKKVTLLLLLLLFLVSIENEMRVLLRFLGGLLFRKVSRNGMEHVPSIRMFLARWFLRKSF